MSAEQSSFLEALGEKLLPCSFLFLAAACIPWFMSLFLHLCQEWWVVFTLYHSDFFFCFHLPLLKMLHAYAGPTQIMEDDLSKVSLLATLTVCNFKFLFAMWLLFSHQVMSNSLQPHGLQHARPPCPSPSPRLCSSSCPLNQWCHPIISSSVTFFSFCFWSFPASGSFPVSQIFASGGQSIRASASPLVLLMSIQG